MFPPLFNRYAGGQSFGFHVDNAVRYNVPGGRVAVSLSFDVDNATVSALSVGVATWAA